MNIDIHAHFVPKALLDDVAAKRHSFPSVSGIVDSGAVRIAFNREEAKRAVAPAMSDVDKRRAWLGERGIDMQIVAGWVDLFGYELPPEEGADWSRFLNEHMLKGVAPVREFAPLATVPMQSGKLAARVLEEALGAGFHGAMIGTQPKGQGGVLDDPDLDPFWETASSRHAVVYVHPTFGARDDRLKAYGLVSAVGRATDTTIAVARLLYSGHLQRYPGVKLVVSHGGAALPFILGRLRASYATESGKRADPMEGFDKLFFDTVVYDARALRFLCDVADVSRVMMGTDQPFAIAESEPVKFIDCCNFNAAGRAAIVGGTAARLFRIPSGEGKAG